MKRIIFFIIFCISIHFGCTGALAAPSDAESLKGKIQACLEAKNPRSITEYSCVRGDFFGGSNVPISEEHTAYIVVMSVRFNELDKKLIAEMEKLQKERKTDGQSWIEYINTVVLPLTDGYARACTLLGGDLEVVALYRKDKKLTATTDGFPQTFCLDLAKRKKLAWENMGYILASKGSAKGYQNSKDVHIDKIKSKYNILLDKWTNYQLTLSVAVQKFTAYIRDPL